MSKKKFLVVLAGIIGLGVLLGLLGSPADATTSTHCTTATDTLTKTDNGHGTPAEWADLVFKRTTKVCGTANGYKITLSDKGLFWTRTGAGSPNGTGTPIAHRVPGGFKGTYLLTATGGDGVVKHHGNTSAQGSTAYVKSLFSDDTSVLGGEYDWQYYTVCKEHWRDASFNDDGQGAQAGNITGKLCKACFPHRRHHPKPTPTVTVTPPVVVTPPGEAKPAQPIVDQPHFTG
jgi:hypothetical protein